MTPQREIIELDASEVPKPPPTRFNSAYTQLDGEFKQKYGRSLRVTGDSANNPMHRRASLGGQAFDVRSKDMSPDEQAFVTKRSKELGLHSINASGRESWATGPHIHIDKGNAQGTGEFIELDQNEAGKPFTWNASIPPRASSPLKSVIQPAKPAMQADDGQPPASPAYGRTLATRQTVPQKPSFSEDAQSRGARVSPQTASSRLLSTTVAPVESRPQITQAQLDAQLRAQNRAIHLQGIRDKGPKHGQIVSAGRNLVARAGETTFGIIGGAAKMLPGQAAKNVADLSDELIRTSEEEQAQNAQGLLPELAGEAGALPPLMLGGGPIGFGVLSALDAHGHGATPEEAIKRGVESAATVKLGGVLSSKLVAPTAGRVAAYTGRAAGNTLAPVITRAATTGDLDVTPSDVAFGALFGLPGGRAQAARKAGIESRIPQPPARLALPPAPGPYEVSPTGEMVPAARDVATPIRARTNLEPISQEMQAKPLNRYQQRAQRGRIGAEVMNARQSERAVSVLGETSEGGRSTGRRDTVSTIPDIRPSGTDRTFDNQRTVGNPATTPEPLELSPAEMSEFDRFIQGQPSPAAKGYTRFYRADRPDAESPQGRGWAQDPEYVSQKYGKGEMGAETLWYTDVPTDVLIHEYGDPQAVSVTDTPTLERLGVKVEPKLYRREVAPSTEQPQSFEQWEAQRKQTALTPQGETGLEGMNVQQPNRQQSVPARAGAEVLSVPGQANRDANQPTVATVRAGTPTNRRVKSESDTLLSAIQKIGFDSSTPEGSDLARYLSVKEGGRPGMVNKQRLPNGEKRGIDNHLIPELQAQGWDITDRNDLLEAVRHEQGGKPVYSTAFDHAGAAEADLRQHLEANHPPEIQQPIVTLAEAIKNHSEFGELSDRIAHGEASDAEIKHFAEIGVYELNLDPDAIESFIEASANNKLAQGRGKELGAQEGKQDVSTAERGTVRDATTQEGDVNGTIRRTIPVARAGMAGNTERSIVSAMDKPAPSESPARTDYIHDTLDRLTERAKETKRSLADLVDEHLSQPALPGQESTAFTPEEAGIARNLAANYDAARGRRAPVRESQSSLLETGPTVESKAAQAGDVESQQGKALVNSPLFEGRKPEDIHHSELQPRDEGKFDGPPDYSLVAPTPEPVKGSHGQFINALFKSPDVDAQIPAFWANPEVRVKLGLPRTGPMSQTKDALAKAMGLPRSSHISPEQLRQWASDNGLGQDALTALDAGEAQYRAYQKRRQTEGGFLSLSVPKAVYNPNQPGQITKASEAISTLRKAGLLTSVKTHLRNVLGTGAFQLTEELSRIPGSMLDLMTSAVTKQRGLTGPSAGAFGRAGYEAATKGVKEAAKIMRQGTPQNNPAQVHAELNTRSPLLNAYANTVFRALSAEDKIMRVYAYRRALEGRAKAEALNERRTNPHLDVTARTKQLVAAPHARLMAESLADAEMATFNNDNALSTAIQEGRRVLRTKGGAGQLTDFGVDMIMPFDRTPTNIIARMLEYTPGGAVYGVSRMAYRATAAKIAGKAFTPQEQLQFARTFGRGVTGSGLITLGYALAAAGYATSVYDEDDKAGNRANKEAGRSPMAIKIGGRWFQIGSFSPLGNLVAIGATLFEKPDKAPMLITKEALTEQPLMRGLNDLLSASKSGDKLGDKAGYIAGSFIPAAVADVAEAVDDKSRKSFGFAGQVMKRIPGVRERLPEDENVQHSRLWAVDPFRTTTEKESPSRDATLVHEANRAANPLPPMTDLKRTEVNAKQEIEQAMLSHNPNTAKIIEKHMAAGEITEKDLYRLSDKVSKSSEQRMTEEFKATHDLERKLTVFNQLSADGKNKLRDEFEMEAMRQLPKLPPYQQKALGPRIGQALRAQ